MSPHLGSFCSPFCASSCVKEPVTQTRYKETKGFFNFISKFFLPISVGVPLPPMYTQFHPRSPNRGAPDTRGFRVMGWKTPKNRQRVAPASWLVTTRDPRMQGVPGLFQVLLQTKVLLQFDACVTLAWPLGDAWVTQGPPKPNPNPNPNPKSAEGRNPKMRKPGLSSRVQKNKIVDRRLRPIRPGSGSTGLDALASDAFSICGTGTPACAPSQITYMAQPPSGVRSNQNSP